MLSRCYLSAVINIWNNTNKIINKKYECLQAHYQSYTVSEYNNLRKKYRSPFGKVEEKKCCTSRKDESSEWNSVYIALQRFYWPGHPYICVINEDIFTSLGSELVSVFVWLLHYNKLTPFNVLLLYLLKNVQSFILLFVYFHFCWMNKQTISCSFIF